MQILRLPSLHLRRFICIGNGHRFLLLLEPQLSKFGLGPTQLLLMSPELGLEPGNLLLELLPLQVFEPKQLGGLDPLLLQPLQGRFGFGFGFGGGGGGGGGK